MERQIWKSEDPVPSHRILGVSRFLRRIVAHLEEKFVELTVEIRGSCRQPLDISSSQNERAVTI